MQGDIKKMQLVFIGAASWSHELEHWLCFVIVFRMLFIFEATQNSYMAGERGRKLRSNYMYLIN